MLTASATHTPDNYLTVNKLQNTPFWHPKPVVSQRETGHFAVRNRPYWESMWHIRKTKPTEAIFSCIFASLGRKRVFMSFHIRRIPARLIPKGTNKGLPRAQRKKPTTQ